MPEEEKPSMTAAGVYAAKSQGGFSEFYLFEPEMGDLVGEYVDNKLNKGPDNPELRLDGSYTFNAKDILEIRGRVKSVLANNKIWAFEVDMEKHNLPGVYRYLIMEDRIETPKGKLLVLPEIENLMKKLQERYKG